MLDREQRLQLLHSLLNSVISIRVEGQANIPKKGGALLICNHVDYIDALIQGLYSNRELVFLAKAELLDIDLYTKLQLYRQEAIDIGVPQIVVEVLDEMLNLYSQFLDDVRILPIIRNYRSGKAKSNQNYYERVLLSAVETIQENGILSVYPEGTRSLNGQMLDFKGFAARIALKSRATIIPTVILGSHGTCDIVNWFTGKNSHKTITYRIGKPLDINSYPTGNDKKAVKEMTKLMQNSVKELMLRN